MSDLVSGEFLYWPEVPWLGYPPYWNNPDQYPETYRAWWNAGGIGPAGGPNVTVADVQRQINDLESGHPGKGTLPTGFQGIDNPIVQYWRTNWGVGPLLITEGEPMDGGEYKIGAQIQGIAIWQAYRLALAMQADKLMVFGRRGRKRK